MWDASARGVRHAVAFEPLDTVIARHSDGSPARADLGTVAHGDTIWLDGELHQVVADPIVEEQPGR